MTRRIVRAVAALTLLVPLLILGVHGPASAQRCSILDPAGTKCNIIGGGGASRPSPGNSAVNPNGDGAPAPYFRWYNTAVPCDAAGGGGWTTLDDLDSVVDIVPVEGIVYVEPGTLRVGELVDPVTGGTNTGFLACVAIGEAAPAAPPAPPTAAEIWGAALTFTPTINLDPYVRGLTGMATGMWYEGETTASVALTLNGYDVVADIAAIEFAWDMGGADRTGRSRHTATTPGSADQPVATHRYALPGLMEITHDVLWTGTAEITGPGFPAGGVTLDLGTATLTVARDYDVIEVRAPVVGGGDQTGTEG